ncbi:hypothetical protein HDU85_004008 [Gaertneriomyces sp. JEL0708]|nr:hypothetical protein HDU85_004008 [Gaertneriomyces sp. JEL0708]
MDDDGPVSPSGGYTPTATNPDGSRKVSAKRAEQNRAAQRAFRERKQRYIKELEVKASLLDTRTEQLNDAENRHRELRSMVDRLTRERDVRIKERELWWREREEVFRLVETLRRDMGSMQKQNEKFKELVFNLWREAKPDANNEEIGASSVPAGMMDEASVPTGSNASTDAAQRNSGGSESGPGRIEGGAAGKAEGLGDLSFGELIQKATAAANTDADDSNQESTEAFVQDLKKRIGYWDEQREQLYRSVAFPPMPVGPTATPPIATQTVPQATSPSGQVSTPVKPSVGVSNHPLAAVASSQGGAVSQTPQPSVAPAGMALSSSAEGLGAGTLPGVPPSFMDQIFSQLIANQFSLPVAGLPGAGVPVVNGMPNLSAFNVMAPQLQQQMAQMPPILASALAAAGKFPQGLAANSPFPMPGTPTGAAPNPFILMAQQHQQLAQQQMQQTAAKPGSTPMAEDSAQASDPTTQSQAQQPLGEPSPSPEQAQNIPDQ